MNAAELSQRLADNAAAVAEYLLPKGKRAQGEWKAGSVSGEAGQSLSVRIAGAKKGVWQDFATGQGGDMLDPVSYTHLDVYKRQVQSCLVTMSRIDFPSTPGSASSGG